MGNQISIKFSGIVVFLFLVLFTKGQQELDLKRFFVKYPNVSKVELEFKNAKPLLIKIESENQVNSTGGKRKVTFYDLCFEGDRFMLDREYAAEVNVLLNFKADSKLIQNTFEDKKLLRAIISPDSIFYKYMHPMNFLIHPSRKDNIDMLKHQLPQPEGHDEKKDTILMFQALVGLDGNLEQMKLTHGKPTEYTEHIIKYFVQEKAKWEPMTKDGRDYRALIDICLKLDNEKYKPSYSRTLRKRNIDIYHNKDLWYWYYE